MAQLSSGPRAVGAGSWLIWRALRGFWRQSLVGDPLSEASLAEALGRFLWGPLPTLMALAALTGVIAGISVASVLEVYDAELLIIGALYDVLLRQILPLVVGIFASGSVSVELASRLGAMSLAREIDALEAMGHDPVPRVLGGPVVAVLAASPVHMLLAALAAFAGAALPLHLSANVAYQGLAHLAVSNAAAQALLTGMAKALLFAALAFGVGAVVGSRPVRIPADIGRRAGRAFTTGLLLIFVAAALWTGLA